ncbi:MAG TPA: RimK/LysX family protein [Candidatus Saccharibacteria bacterium]|nr:RimK/LysX family protein [Candidatus Saccharibacteria bacterium]
MQQRRIIGNYKTVSFPEFGISDTKAKIDTGAETGALHSTNIRLITKDNKQHLTFSPFDHPEITYSTTDYYQDEVKSSNGMTEKRYYITTNIQIDKETLPITLSLTNRESMKYPVLIGVKFLAKYKYIVDLSITDA